MKHNEERSKRKLIPFLLIIASLGLFYFANLKPSVKSTKSNFGMNHPDAEKKLNQHLQETNQKIELQQFKRKAENEFSAPKVGSLIPFKELSDGKVIPLEAPEDENTASIRQDYRSEQEVDYANPSTIVQGELADKLENQEYAKRYKEEYIRQFVQNAKEHGWKVIVDKNGVIKSAEPLQTSGQNLNIFDPTSSSTQ